MGHDILNPYQILKKGGACCEKSFLASLTILTILALPLGSAASAEQQTPPSTSLWEVHGNIPPRPMRPRPCILRSTP